jgi:hypothetical protein
MTAISVPITTHQKAFNRVATVTTGAAARTDWFWTPTWAQYAMIWIDLTVISANSLTTTIFTANPITLTSTGSGTLKAMEHAALTAATSANTIIVQMGPGVTGIADDTTVSATVVSYASLNGVLPPLLGIKTDPGGGNSTYTVDIFYRGRS